MLDVVSTAKNTNWFSFPTLCTKGTYSHVENQDVDFQVIPNQNSFIEFNKKFGFELLRTVHSNGKSIVQRVSKRQIENLSCGAVSKTTGDDFAIGLSTGYIRIFNIKSNDFTPVKFKPEKIGRIRKA